MILGITGKMASGKSHYAKLISSLRGVPYFDSDYIFKIIIHEHSSEFLTICNNHQKTKQQKPNTFLENNYFTNIPFKQDLENWIMPYFWNYISEIEREYDCDLIIELFSIRSSDRTKFECVIEIEAKEDLRIRRMAQYGIHYIKIHEILKSQKTNHSSPSHIINTTGKTNQQLFQQFNNFYELI